MRNPLSILLSGLLAAACGAETPDPSEVFVTSEAAENIETVSQAIIRGQLGHPRTEVGRFGGCTATWIGGNWAITAAHCFQYIDTPPSQTTGLSFTTSANGWVWGTQGGGDSVGVVQTFSLTDGNGLGPSDVMLLRLDRAPTAPAGITPARLLPRPPTSGNATIFGAGCSRRNTGIGVGAMRYFETTAGTPTGVLCPGDSGGPKVAGLASERGGIYGVNSGCQGPIDRCDTFGDVTAYRSQIFSIMLTWDLYGQQDVDASAWCMSSVESRHFGDVNGDGVVDLICHHRGDGSITTAIGTQRLMRPSNTSSGPWCNAALDRVFSGDFDGDGRTDLLCRSVQGNKRIDYARNGYTGTDYAGPSSDTFCTAPSDRLLVGDFDGDGRSDLLCHNAQNGSTAVEFADVRGRFHGLAAWRSNVAFCNVSGDTLFAGDANGDGKSDLICHRRTDGSLLVALSRGGRSAPLRNRPDTWLVGPDPGTTVRFCTGFGRLDVGDFNGNGIADLRCTNTVGGSTLRSLAGTPSGWYRWENRFGWNGGMRLRTPMAATTPWLAR